MKSHLIAIAAVAALASSARAELKAPLESPRSIVQQVVGLTDITVNYCRPAVNGRSIWGKLVPYGEVWRAGANENTTVTFSTDVKIAGKPLRAGTYGLHMLPTAKDWTIIFSNASSSWGSYSYDQKEDALRVTATPQALPYTEERLAYRFDNPSATKTTLTLAWEKLAVSVPIEVDTPKVVMASMRNELRGSAGFAWEPWEQAAGYWLKNGGNLDEALRLVSKSIEMHPAYSNYMTRAAILDKKGDKAGAKAARDAGLPRSRYSSRSRRSSRARGTPTIASPRRSPPRATRPARSPPTRRRSRW
jgi:Protein of unknown function (DUF2911)